tara:strand:+ start:41 stop:280 length:240 start_codon:yes stop_codon:yes gene_type:complete
MPNWELDLVKFGEKKKAKKKPSVFDFDDGSRGNYCRKCGAKQKNKDKKCKLCGATGDYTYYRNDDGDSGSHPFDTKMIR